MQSIIWNFYVLVLLLPCIREYAYVKYIYSSIKLYICLMSPPLPDCLGLTDLIKAWVALPPSGLGIQRGAEELFLHGAFRIKAWKSFIISRLSTFMMRVSAWYTGRKKISEKITSPRNIYWWIHWYQYIPLLTPPLNEYHSKFVIFLMIFFFYQCIGYIFRHLPDIILGRRPKALLFHEYKRIIFYVSFL